MSGRADSDLDGGLNGDPNGDPDWDPDWDLPPPDPSVFSLDAELKANPRLRMKDIQALGSWARQQGLPEAEDVELVKFLHSCDYSLENAKSCMKVFCSCRADTPDLFVGFDLGQPSIQSILDVIVLAVLPRRTPENYRIIYNGLKTSDTKHYVFRDVCRVLFMVIESIFVTEPTVNGIVFLHDMELASMGHFWKFGFTLPRKVANYTLGGMPLKNEDIHLGKCSGYIDGGLKMMRHFGSKKGWEKVHIHHGDDYSDLHARVPKHCLPREFGGTLPSVQELAEMTVKRLESLRVAMETRRNSRNMA